MFSTEIPFLLSEQIISRNEYDHSVHPIVGGTPIIIRSMS